MEDRMLSDEILLALIKKAGSGTSNYNDLENKPKIGGVELSGNKSLADLDIASAQSVSEIKDGQEINSFSGVESALSNVDEAIEAIDGKIDDATVYPYADAITIEDAVPANLAECKVKIEPVQDLHGYDHPWAGGGWKNKLNIPSSVVTTTINGITYTVTRNEGGAVTEIDADGTATADATIDFSASDIPIGNVILTGCPSGGGNDTWQIIRWNSGWTDTTRDNGSGVTYNNTTASNLFRLRVKSGVTVSHKKFYPMIRLATETDATFAPYSNICPITGHTEASVEVTDGDEITKTYTIAPGDTVYGGTVDFNSGVMTITNVYYTLTNTDAINLTSDSGMIRVGVPIPVDSIVWTSENTKSGKLICDMFDETTNDATYNGAIGIHYRSNGSHYVVVGFGDDFPNISSFNDAKTWIGNNTPHIVYELATPTTVQLTPQQIQLLKGTNTLTASTGDISVTVNGVSGAIGQVQEQVNELVKQLPDAPTTDGAYVLTVTVSDGTPTYSWESGS